MGSVEEKIAKLNNEEKHNTLLLAN